VLCEEQQMVEGDENEFEWKRDNKRRERNARATISNLKAPWEEKKGY
jgi:hypothetical protein